MERRFIVLLTTIALAAGGGAETAAAADPMRQADGQVSASGLLARGSGYSRPGGSERVRELQRILQGLGVEPGPVDGLFGPRTERAVLAFQQAHGLAVDGVVGPQTLRHLRYHLGRENAFLSRGSGYSNAGGSGRVRQVQRALRTLRFRPGPVDGLFGPRTERAVLAFQQAHDLAVDGVVGPQTLRQVRDEMARRARVRQADAEGQSPKGSSRTAGERTRLERKLPPAATVPAPAAAARDADGSGFPIRPVAALAGILILASLLVLAQALRRSRRRLTTSGSRSVAVDLATAARRAPVSSTLVSLVSLARSKGLSVGQPPFPSERAGTRDRPSGGEPAQPGSPGDGEHEPPRGDATRGREARMLVATPKLEGGIERDEDTADPNHVPLEAPRLTDRELTVLRLVAEGFTNVQIGARLYLSRHTVKEHLGHAMQKLGATNRVRAVGKASRLGLLGESGSDREPRSEGKPAAIYSGPNGSQPPSEVKVPAIKIVEVEEE